MNVASTSSELLSFFKALADENRLRNGGLFAIERRSVEQPALILNVLPPAVSHHLFKLENSGLAIAKAEGYYSVRVFENITRKAWHNACFQAMCPRQRCAALCADRLLKIVNPLTQ